MHYLGGFKELISMSSCLSYLVQITHFLQVSLAQPMGGNLGNPVFFRPRIQMPIRCGHDFPWVFGI